MEIGRHNYEAFLLDLMEGRLSVEDQQHLLDFLQMNPDCTGDLMEAEPWTLEREKISFPDPERLRKVFPDPATGLNENNFDLFSIARMEGDLTVEQIADHQAMVDRDEKRSRQWMEWQKTRLEPESLLFRGKGRLKRINPQKIRVLWMGVISSAAAIALIIVLFNLGPAEPLQDLTSGSVSETGILQADEPAEQAEVQPTDELPNQAEVQEHVELADQTEVLPATESKEDPAPRDDLKPRSLHISESHLNASRLVGQTVPDQIKPLEVSPVPIHLRNLSLAQISDMELREIVESYTEENNITLWSIANAGIRGINKIAGSDISLLASRDEEGDVSGFQLKSRRFSLTRPLDREE